MSTPVRCPACGSQFDLAAPPGGLAMSCPVCLSRIRPVVIDPNEPDAIPVVYALADPAQAPTAGGQADDRSSVPADDDQEDARPRRRREDDEDEEDDDERPAGQDYPNWGLKRQAAPTRLNWPRFSTAQVRAITGGILLFIVVLVVVCFAFFWHNDRPFRKQLPDYLQLRPAQGPLERWQVAGKMVLVDEDEEAVSPLHFQLPGNLRARGPDEVSAVVQIKWIAVPVKYQTPPANIGRRPLDEVWGYRSDCRIRVYDWASRFMLTEAVIQGDPPPAVITRESEGTMPRPTARVLEYLVGLPGKDFRPGPIHVPNPPAQPPPERGRGGQGHPPAEPTPVPPPATDFAGLVGYWPFEDDDPAQRVADRSGKGNDGKAEGATRVDGVRGKALAFADRSWLDYGTGPALNFPAGGAFTLACWVKTASATGTVISQRSSDDGAAIDLLLYSGQPQASVRHDRGRFPVKLLSPTRISDDRWHHCALLRSGQTVRLFVDGEPSAESAGGDADGPITTDLRAVGRERRWFTHEGKRDPSCYLTGAVDELCIFNRALDPKEIKALAGR
jgi:hypothetical protein